VEEGCGFEVNVIRKILKIASIGEISDIDTVSKGKGGVRLPELLGVYELAIEFGGLNTPQIWKAGAVFAELRMFG